ncbi:hypothetical protein [Galbibacter sp. BG1]|uniref:hypothetical protein n=1 Tax=Galbibacter sp. BG1 TaxID=1170699 RepID=UPI00210687D5|nr:hypothetical protein [Galbibacter sp. BG1]
MHIAAVNEWDEKHLTKTWYVYLINNCDTPIEGTIVVSKGYGDDLKTSTMRHGLGDFEAKSFRKVEILQEDVFKLTNEYFVTFFAENKLFERKFLFQPHQVSENNTSQVPLLQMEGVLAQ